MASILVLDADNESRASVVERLSELGHEVSESGSAEDALETLPLLRPDLMVVEYDLPDRPGLELLTEVKRSAAGSGIRVVLTAGRRRINDLASAFDSGADDVVTRPIDMDELALRVTACLRRPPASRSPGELHVGGIRIDSVGQRVFVDDEPAVLAPREYRLLLFFVENRERVFGRDQLLAEVWGRDADVGARTVDVHVRRLRSLLEPYGYDKFLQTVRGSGYRFSPEPRSFEPPEEHDLYGIADD